MSKRQPRVCQQCGLEYKGQGKKFCSNSCKMRFRNLTDNVAKRPDVKEKLSRVAKEQGRQKHLMTPEARAKAIPAISAAISGRKLTDEHKRAISEGVKRAGNVPPRNPHLVGPNHPNWTGGSSTIRNKDFHTEEYRKFRSDVLSRDDWTCSDCGKRGGKLQVHHVKPWGPFPELRHDPSNGVTLCRLCHHARHRGSPKPTTDGPRRLSDLQSDPGGS